MEIAGNNKAEKGDRISQAPTYDLRAGEENSNEFYERLVKFSDDVLQKGKLQFSDTIQNYKSFLNKNEIRDKRNEGEYLLDILSIGCFWLNYGVNANNSGKLFVKFVNYLNSFKRINGFFAKGIAYVRTRFLNQEILFPNLNEGVLPEFSLKKFESLINWLKATDEFEQEVYRFELMNKYLLSLNSDIADNVLCSFVYFSAWFEYAAKKEFAPYSKNLKSFLSNNSLDESRDDLAFMMKPELQYYLNIVGAELINNSLFEEYVHSSTLSVWAPTCMRGLPENECKSLKTSNGIICTACNKNCNIGKVASMGKEFDYSVRIIEHSSDLEKQIEMESSRAIIGIACASSLLSGGLVLRKYEIPAQCVFLDFCGKCRHWPDSVTPAQVNLEKLKEIVLNNKFRNDELSLKNLKRA